jgi:hypothetical protein
MRHPPLPAAWTIEEHNNARFIVRDKNGQALELPSGPSSIG